ncbi:MAG: cohesin domain-containing protein, partial [Gracilimonas sp.]
MKLLNNITKGMRWAVVLLLMALPLSLFGQVEVSLPDTALKAGETIEVPIYVSNMNEADGVVSGEFEFNFNESYFDITGFNKTGTILESVGSVLYFEGTDRLAFASTDTVSGEGVLVKLLVKGNDDADYFRNSNLTFTSAKLNEGDPAITTTDGSLRILGVRISPKSNIQITNGDTLQFSLQEDVTNPVSWTVTDTNIASIDTNGQLIAKTTGTVQVKGVDAEGLKDSTSFFTILPNVFTDFTVSMPDTSTTQTLYLDLPIRTSEVTGLGITSAEFDISFSSNYFSLEEVLSGPLTSVWSSLTVNIDDNRVRIAGAGTDSLEGSGDLYILRFKVTDNNSGNSTISFNSGIFNEDLSSDLENATVYVNNAPDINVFPSDTAVSIGNSLSFEVTGGNGTAPYTWESSNAGIGDIDASTGVLTGISRGDIIVNARDAENFPSDLVNVRVNDFDA